MSQLLTSAPKGAMTGDVYVENLGINLEYNRNYRNFLTGKGGMKLTVYIVKPDLDTCLTAVVLGVGDNDDVLFGDTEAPEELLSDPAVLCIEAGGSGRVEEYNFDHHLPGVWLPPACRQALTWQGSSDSRLERLVSYVSMVDEGTPIVPAPGFPSLSGLFSGMLLTEQGVNAQFRAGCRLLREVLGESMDPFGSLPQVPHWQQYLDAKSDNSRRLGTLLDYAQLFHTRQGRLAALLDFPPDGPRTIGGFASLFAEGAEVVILHDPLFGTPPVRKFTIAGRGVVVADLLPALERLEKGWGGRDAIIGSPRTGTTLDVSCVQDFVVGCL